MREQSERGRYRTAGEEEAEHRRLVQKWLYEDLTDEELDLVPADLRARVQSYFGGLIDEGLRSAEKCGWLDGPDAVENMLRKIAARQRDCEQLRRSSGREDAQCTLRSR